MIDLYIDLGIQMQVVVSHFHLCHIPDLALKSNIWRHNDRKLGR